MKEWNAIYEGKASGAYGGPYGSSQSVQVQVQAHPQSQARQTPVHIDESQKPDPN